MFIATVTYLMHTEAKVAVYNQENINYLCFRHIERTRFMLQLYVPEINGISKLYREFVNPFIPVHCEGIMGEMETNICNDWTSWHDV